MCCSLQSFDTRTKDSFRTFTMFRRLNLLLVFCFAYHFGTPPVGNTPVPLSEKKGGNATLICEFTDNNISFIELEKQKEQKNVCETEECRYFKKGACDIIIKNLSFSDAGTYTLKVFHNNNQSVKYSQDREYHLHIHDDISVKKDKLLKLDVLLINADKVEKNSSGEWTEVWTRGHGVSSDQLNDSDGKLTFKAFMDIDAGTYRVLDSKGKILITVTVTITESSPESGSMGGQGDTKNDTEPLKPNGNVNTTDYTTCQIICIAAGVVLVVIVVILAVKKCQQKKTEGKIYNEIPLQEQKSTVVAHDN